MKYMMLIYGNEGAWQKMSEEESKKAYMAYMDFNQKLVSSGKLVSGEQLQSSKSAKTIQSLGGKVVTTDGPFAETKEQLGGYYILNVESEKEAIELASMCPAIHGGKIELRPLHGTSAS